MWNKLIICITLMVLSLLLGSSCAEGSVILPYYTRCILPDAFEERLELVESYEQPGIMDCYSVDICRLTENVGSVFLKLASTGMEYHDLPMSHDEYNGYVERCFEWPLRKHDFLAGYNLTEENAKGCWYYLGDYDLAWNNDPARYINGVHEIFIYLENEGIVIIMEVDM